MGSFEVCYSFAGFAYLYCLINQSVVVFCLVFFRKSTAQFFSNVHVSFLFRGKSTVQYFFVFVNFSNVHACFVLCHIQFFVYFNFSNVHVYFMLCHVQFFVFFNSSNVHVCFVLRHRIAVQFFIVFVNFSNFDVCFVLRHLQFFVFFNSINVP